MKLRTLGLILRTSLPILGASLLLPACGGKDNGKGGTENMGGAGPTGASCETDAECDDDVYCNGEEECVSGTCRQGNSITCSDGIKCTVDRCREEDESCESEAADEDGDGHGDASCEDEDGTPLGDDCNDDDSDSFPGNEEVCDPDNRDEDCDPSTPGTRDADQDSYLDASCCNVQSDDSLLCGDDCDDRKTNVNPAATEACDFLDNNCDGDTDEGVSVEMYEDADHDSRGSDDAGTVKTCPGAVGFALVDGDCDDTDPEVFDGQFEICDGKDNNCSGVADEVQEQAPWYSDIDKDGYGDPGSTPVLSCYRIAGRVLSQNDCEDGDNKVNPNATEICDGKDNDCNGVANFKLPGTNNFEDDDSDGAADGECGGTDCNDRDPRTSEGAEEVCDHVDNDCDGDVDEKTVQNIWYIDNDGDGWGVVLGSALASCDPIANRASNFGDCNDDDAAVKPGVVEFCDGIDNDCDGVADEGAAVRCGLNNALSMCGFSECAIFSCLPGYRDADFDPVNGCEVVVNPADLMTTNPCTDNAECDDKDNCNGIESCNAGFCRLGTPINCDAGPSVISGDVVISTSLDVKDLSGISRIAGDVTIENTLLSSLVGLESLKVIDGNLEITGNGKLLRLSGSALSNLEVVGGDILIEGNPNLISVSLPSLISANSLMIINNQKLPAVDGYPALARIGGSYLDQGEPCSGMGGLEIKSNMSLQVINAFELLGSVEGDVCVTANSQLTDLEFPKLTQINQAFKVGELFSDLTMPVLKAVGGAIDLSAGGGEGGGGAFTSIAMPALEEVGGDLTVSGGGTTLKTLDFGSVKETLDISLNFLGYADSLTSVDFSSLETATDISIVYSAQTVGVPVWAFPALTDVQSMYVNMSGAVQSFRAPVLARAGSLDVSMYSEGLQSLLFPALSTVDSSVNVYSNSSTPLDLVQFTALSSVGGTLTIQAMSTAVDLANLTTLGSPYSTDLTLCVAPADVCSVAAVLVANSWTGAENYCSGVCDGSGG